MAEDLIDTTPFARKFRLTRTHNGFCYELCAEVPVFSLPAAVLKRLEAAGSGPFGQEDLIPFGEPVCLNLYGPPPQWDHDGYCTGGAGAYALRPDSARRRCGRSAPRAGAGVRGRGGVGPAKGRRTGEEGT